MPAEHVPGHAARESPDERVLRHALEKLRAREGVTVDRLRAGQGEAAGPLLSLAAVRRYASIYELDLPQAARDVVAECVREALGGSDRIVADAILALGAHAEEYQDHGIEPRVIAGLRSGLLSRRREMLLAHWDRLHLALRAGQPHAPSDRSLRGTIEPQILARLARQLIRREVYSLGVKGVVMPGPAEGAPDPAPGGRVIVLGGAVMDATFQTKTLPQVETSAEAYDFDLSPGGKGLTQAVAAARLGLDVSLLAAVTDDHFGHQIVGYLRRERVDTSMLKLVGDARTPFTGVIEFEFGNSIAVNWRNDREVRLTARDVEAAEPQLRGADAVLVTFEPPRETVQRALAAVHAASGPRPLIIVTPGQPYPDGGLSGQALAQIDYLVARAWELSRYASSGQGKFDLDVVARQLLAYGVETLCVPTGAGCAVYSADLGAFTVPAFPSQYRESSAARDAFCAALAAKLIEAGRQFSEEVALWATAAMAAAIADYPLPNSMPDRRRVDQLLSRSRFAVAPRPGEAPRLSDAAGAASPPG